jgi:hypothetical protein
MLWMTYDDKKYMREKHKDIMSDLNLYDELTGKHWGPYNLIDARKAGYANAETWHAGLKKAIAEVKAAK